MQLQLSTIWTMISKCTWLADELILIENVILFTTVPVSTCKISHLNIKICLGIYIILNRTKKMTSSYDSHDDKNLLILACFCFVPAFCRAVVKQLWHLHLQFRGDCLLVAGFNQSEESFTQMNQIKHLTHSDWSATSGRN